MKIIYTDRHVLRDAKTELDGGLLVPPYECPRRAEMILAECQRRNVGEVVNISPRDKNFLRGVHNADYLHFLETGWTEWQQAGFQGEMIANCWPSRAMPRLIPPRAIEGKLGYYALAGETAISPGTWDAALAAAQAAVTGAEQLRGGERAAFALCRPPGHHAATDMFGGYCFLNNAALAAQHFLDHGASRVAVLDVDFHHGNGTQEIFYRRDDVLFVSLHGDPRDAFPHFLGHADETGEGCGDGYNFNYPMPKNTAFDVWRQNLLDGLKRIRNYAPDALVVSLGVDTYCLDPISFFKLRQDDFKVYGGDIAALKLPTLLVMEGGYAVEDIGVNTVNVLEGIAQAI